MKKMTILHLTGMKSLKYGSLETYLVHLIKMCNQLNYNTVLQYESLPRSERFLSDVKERNTRIILKPIDGNPISACFRCFYLIMTLKPEIINVHFGNTYVKYLVPVFAWLAGAKRTVCTVHSMTNYQGKHWARIAYNLYDCVLPVSNAVRENLLQTGVKPNVLRTNYLGLFGERVRSDELRKKYREDFNIPLDSTVLACIAFDAKSKGVDILLKAFKKVVEKHDNVYLLSIGVNLEESALPGQADDLNISHRIHWAGIIDNGYQALNAADIYVQPSRSEGLPLSIMEAMSMKFPIVSTNVSGNSEAVMDQVTGLIVEPNAESLASGISRMLSMPSKWADFGEAGFKKFENMFDGNESVKRLVKKYYQI